VTHNLVTSISLAGAVIYPGNYEKSLMLPSGRPKDRRPQLTSLRSSRSSDVAMREVRKQNTEIGSDFACSREDLERQLTRWARQTIESQGRLILALEGLQLSYEAVYAGTATTGAQDVLPPRIAKLVRIPVDVGR
jgi:hypothetical protein